MKSEPGSQTAHQTSFFGTPETPGELVFSLTVPGRLPSWNEILGMEHWQRYAFKKKLAADFLSALRAIESDYWTKTICAKSTPAIYCATLELFLTTAQQKRKSKLARKRLEEKSKKESSSKSSDFSKVPF